MMLKCVGGISGSGSLTSFLFTNLYISPMKKAAVEMQMMYTQTVMIVASMFPPVDQAKTRSANPHRWSVIPAAIAGVTLNVW